MNGILCLSSNWCEPLPWGHYADKHRGMCLGFDVSEESWKAVKYVSERSKVAYLAPLTDDLADHLVLSKFKAWEYEREYRTIFDLQEMSPDPVNGHYFTGFSDRITLREVIVGHKCPVTRARLKSVLGEDAASVEQKKARPAFRTFEVVEQRQKRMWK
ncbi:hypothetical protein BLJAPNOD_01338 [Ensifer sp. M14]|nr:hypothetical protein BLJAPNOD_01338 [Ensifer sp. M14]